MYAKEPEYLCLKLKICNGVVANDDPFCPHSGLCVIVHCVLKAYQGKLTKVFFFLRMQISF